MSRRAADDAPLADQGVRALGFEPTEAGWIPQQCIYCGGQLRRFIHWGGPAGDIWLDADCGPAFLRTIGTEIARAIKADLTTTTTEVGG